MWRKAFLAAVCLCLRWGAALGGESRDGVGTAPGARTGPGGNGSCRACLLLLGNGVLGEALPAWRERGVCNLSFVKLSRRAWDAAGPGCCGVGLEGAGE